MKSLKKFERYLLQDLSKADVPSSKVVGLANQLGISSRTIHRFKAKHGVRSYRKAGRWWFTILPPGPNQPLLDLKVNP